MIGSRWAFETAGLLVGLLLIPIAATASEDRVGKREVCTLEARQRFKPRQARSVDLFQITIERRQAYIQACMAGPSVDWVTTGSVGAEKAPPLPPHRPKSNAKQP